MASDPEIARRSEFPDTGKGGMVAVGMMLWRLDDIGSTDAPTPNSNNWEMMDGSTISGGIWDGDTLTDIDGGMVQFDLTSGIGNILVGSSHSHTMPKTGERLVSPCSGTGAYTIPNSFYSLTEDFEPQVFKLEPWVRIK